MHCACSVADGKLSDTHWSFRAKKISFNSKPNTTNELLYAIYVRCTRAVRIRVFIILNGFIFMHCNCIYDKWPWCVLVKKDVHAYWIYSTAHGYLIIDSLIDFFLILGNAKFVKKNSFKENIHVEYCYQYRKAANGGWHPPPPVLFLKNN